MSAPRAGTRDALLGWAEATGGRMSGLLFSNRPSFAFMPRAVATVFVENLLFLLSVLELEGVRYVVHYGTLLGARRLAGVAPWDEDGDVYVLGSDLESVRARVEPHLRGHGFDLWLGGADFFWVRQRRWPAAQGYNALHFLAPVLASEGDRTPAHSDAVLSAEELGTPRRLPFYSSFVWAPCAPDRILDRIYGASGGDAVMSRFRPPPIGREAEEFWRRARPADGPLDWEAISARFRSRSRWSHLTAMPWLWFNGAWNHHVLKGLIKAGTFLERRARTLRESS